MSSNFAPTEKPELILMGKQQRAAMKMLLPLFTHSASLSQAMMRFPLLSIYTAFSQHQPLQLTHTRY